MSKLVFDAAAVEQRLNHALAAKEHSKVYGQHTAEPGVILVHDQGVYIMSNGMPREIDPNTPCKSIVVYAERCHPDQDDDWYDTARALVGGDDFAEFIPANIIKRAIDFAKAHGGKLVITINGDQLAFNTGIQTKDADAKWLTAQMRRKTLVVDEANLSRGVFSYRFPPSDLTGPRGADFIARIRADSPGMCALNAQPIDKAVDLFNRATRARHALFNATSTSPTKR